jgi:hypothetical protein
MGGGWGRLPAKVEADKVGGLAFLGFSVVGVQNVVLELWRYPSAQACIE